MRAVAPLPIVNAPIRGVQPHASKSISAPYSSVNVSYLESSPIRVRGSVSGKYYEFSGSHPVQLVDARDAASLLGTRFFRRA